MYLKKFLCIILALCICPVLVLAAEKSKDKDESKGALQQAKSIEKTSKDAAKDAKAGKEPEAREKAGRGW
jgi:hypothetical protein